MYIQTLNYYDLYAQSLRKKYVKAIKYYVPTPQPERVETTTTSKVYRRWDSYLMIHINQLLKISQEYKR